MQIQAEQEKQAPEFVKIMLSAYCVLRAKTLQLIYKAKVTSKAPPGKIEYMESQLQKVHE